MKLPVWVRWVILCTPLIALGGLSIAMFKEAPSKNEKTHTNRLINETSPYLLQHAHNPVNWYPWGDEALEKAKRENKPIFLSIGYSTCYWCHVMERESFENDEIAAIMNKKYVSIKVDREERPDLDQIYMQATILITRGRGGWPMSVFLTPHGKPFFAGTYFPRSQFSNLLHGIAEAWRDNQPELESQSDLVVQAISESRPVANSGTEISDERLMGRALQQIKSRFDPRHGGFGNAPKFPPAQELELLLQQYRESHNQELLNIVTKTLDSMARGGLYDQVGGGFHRYSTDEQWLVPHFEKMLYDNGQLLSVYAEAYAITKNSFYLRIVEEIHDFILREMTNAEGGFYSALDAESIVHGEEKEEGAYYVWKPGEIKKVLGKEDGTLFCNVYDIGHAGNFEGKSIPNLINRSVEEWAKELGLNSDQLWSKLDTMRTKLLTERRKRHYPHLDDKVLTSWNALMIRGFTRAYKATGDEKHLRMAERAAEFVLDKLRQSDGRLLRTYRANTAHLNAYVDDYAFLSTALLDLHEATRNVSWLRESKAISNKMIELFWDDEEGGFFFTSHDHPDKLIVRRKDATDGALPSGNAIAIRTLTRLTPLTGNSEWALTAERCLKTYRSQIIQTPLAFTSMLIGSHMILMAKNQSIPATAPTSELVTANVFMNQDKIRPGDMTQLTVRIQIAEGWHINSYKPTFDFLIATEIDVSTELPITLTNVSYPEGQSIKLGFSDDELSVYEDSVSIVANLMAAEEMAVGDGTLKIRISYQACDDKSCQPPADITLDVPVEVVPVGTPVTQSNTDALSEQSKPLATD